MKFQLALLLLLTAESIFGLGLPPHPSSDYAFGHLQSLQTKLKKWYLEKYNLTSEDELDKVIGGVDAAPGEAPFQAQIHIRSVMSGGISFTCGGSLINSRTVLSAAHCVNYFNDYRIRYGSNSRLFSPYALAEVAELKVHPQFNLDTITNDVALFILRKPVQPGTNVAAVNLQPTQLSADTSVTLFGFGLMNGKNQNSLAERLQKAQLEVSSEAECNQFFSQLRMTRTPGHLCVSAKNRGSCNGDSGGPLLVSSSGLQTGIVSFGLQNCPPGAIDVFTNVPYFLKWIRANAVGEPIDQPDQPDQPNQPDQPVTDPPTTRKPTTKRPSWPPTCSWVCQ